MLNPRDFYCFLITMNLKRQIKAILLVVLITLLIDGCSYNNEEQLQSFQIAFLDIGQGDATLVMCNGKTMLIDTGDRSHIYSLERYLDEFKIKKIDYLVITHPDNDHLGGINAAFDLDVGNVYCSSYKNETSEYKDFVDVCKKANKRIIVPEKNSSFNLGAAKVEVLAVDTDINNSNDSSIVLMIHVGDTKFLMTGDADKATEMYLMENYDDLSCDVLKVPHHGAYNMVTGMFLRRVNPDYAVISVGANNSYNHPTENVVDILNTTSKKLFITSVDHTIIFTSDGYKVSYTIR